MNKRIIAGLVALSICVGIGTMVSAAAKLGDVNSDKKIDIEDAVSVINHVNGNAALSKAQMKLADVDGNNKVDIEDAVKIIANINGIKPLPYVEVVTDEEDSSKNTDPSSQGGSDSSIAEDDTLKADQKTADKIALNYFNTICEYMVDEYCGGRKYDTVTSEDFAVLGTETGLTLDKAYTAKGDKAIAGDRSFEDIEKYKGTLYVSFDGTTADDLILEVRWVSADGVEGKYPKAKDKIEQEDADYFAKCYYNSIASYFTEEQEENKRTERDIMENDFTAASSEGVKVDKDYTAKGDKFIRDEKAINFADVYKGTVFVEYDPYLESFPFVVRWVSADGITGQYPKEINHPYNAEKAAKLKNANEKARDYFNYTAEYIADNETMGRKTKELLDDGDFIKATAAGGLDLMGDSDGKGDKYLIEQASYDSSDEGYVYIYFEKDDSYDFYHYFVQWKDKDGTIGQYPTPPEYEYCPMIKFGTFWEPTSEILSMERTLTEEMVKKANGEAKSFYNTAMEYIADQETKGREAAKIFAEGDFAEANSENGMKIEGTHTANGDMALYEFASPKFDKYIGVGTVYVGKRDDTEEDEYYFVQFITKDGAIGQYPQPISFEDNTSAKLGTFYKK